MRLDPAAYPFLAGSAVAAIIPGLAFGAMAALPGLIASAVFLFFFRDPDRRIPAGAHLVVSPADGRVLVAGPPVPGAAPPGAWQQVGIFLSPMDVHVNRVPVAGVVSKVEYRPGRFLPAYRPDSATENERCEIWIDHEGQPIVVRQIVGVLARRVVCRAAPGDAVAAGNRYGVMKFGSRMDVFLPSDANIRVKAGDRVRGGETVIAVLH